MDDSKSMIIPFWEEEDTMVVDLSNSEIYNILDRFSITVFMTNRAWWNSNIVMENFMPQFMPFIQTDGGDVNDLLKLFAQRFVQRNTTHDVPLRKGVGLVHGLMIYKDDLLTGTFLKNPSINKFEYIQSGMFQDDPHIVAAKIDDNTIVRQSGYKYFNGAKYV